MTKKLLIDIMYCILNAWSSLEQVLKRQKTSSSNATRVAPGGTG